ncbi:UNVERIFIED_CONTAM: hypothetical protein NCL1_19780 [Trichonephila clavipes]
MAVKLKEPVEKIDEECVCALITLIRDTRMSDARATLGMSQNGTFPLPDLSSENSRDVAEPTVSVVKKQIKKRKLKNSRG